RPGLYSLEATSLDEQIARNVITGEQKGVRRPDVVVAVVDATNLERNLYLVTQLFDYKVPVVIALTMIDVFEKQDHEINIAKLSQLLKTPVVAINAKSGRGIKELAKEVHNAAEKGESSAPVFSDVDETSGPHAKIFARYSFISKAVQESTRHNDTPKLRISSKIDKVLTHKFF